MVERGSTLRSDGSPTEAAVEVCGLTKHYGKTVAVDHVSFEVRRGEVFGFLGPNGAGKTTTVRMLTTLLPPTSGTARVCGHDVVRDPYWAKENIGVVPETSNVYVEISAWENLMFTAELYGVPRKASQRRARELLELLGLWEKRAGRALGFSKGMKRRLVVAMALVHKPPLIFMDERASGLDVQSTLGMPVKEAWLLVLALVVSSGALASLGVLFASVSTPLPGNIMMLGNMVRMPLLCVSGIFIPLDSLPAWGRPFAFLSPLTYANDLVRHSVSGTSYVGAPVALGLLLAFWAAFLVVGVRLHTMGQKA